MSNMAYSASKRIPKFRDARGVFLGGPALLQPRNKMCSKDLWITDDPAFWSSRQFYVEGCSTAMFTDLEAVPDHQFCYIQNLCFDFGWHPTTGFVPDGRSASPERKLLDSILHRGNDRLVVKVLWSTSMSSGLEGLSKREREKWPEDFRNMASEFRRFRKRFRN
jgi:hypothetical protein